MVNLDAPLIYSEFSNLGTMNRRGNWISKDRTKTHIKGA